MKWLLFAGGALIAWKIWQSGQKPFAGMVSSGWGGNLTGNLPTNFANRATINNAPSYGVTIGNMGAVAGIPSKGPGSGSQGSAG
jgi:hypothetical protein